MITLMGTMMLLVSMFLISPMNPVKMMMILIVLSMVMFSCTLTNTGTAWISSIFFLIFIGGVMIMFMVLSALLPNEKNMKLKISGTILMFFTLLIFNLNFIQSENSSLDQIGKTAFFTNLTMEAVIMMILMYFLSFVYMLSNTTSGLRSFQC